MKKALHLYADATIDIQGRNCIWTEAWKGLQTLVCNPNYSKQAAVAYITNIILKEDHSAKQDCWNVQSYCWIKTLNIVNFQTFKLDYKRREQAICSTCNQQELYDFHHTGLQVAGELAFLAQSALIYHRHKTTTSCFILPFHTMVLEYCMDSFCTPWLT